MNNNFMSPLPTFTLESLVTNAQWVGRSAQKERQGEFHKERLSQSRFIEQTFEVGDLIF